MNPMGCPRRTGFLFPHGCDRLTSIGCPDCQNGQVEDPYESRADRDGYDDYDTYDSSSYAGVEGVGGAEDAADFNEADGESLVRPEEEEFEDDLTES